MKTYSIQEGSHSSGFHFMPAIGNRIQLVGSFKFLNSCLYDLKDSNNSDMNKLIGLSMGYHMNNSVRIGWRCVGNIIELYAYIHLKGKIITADLNNDLINFKPTFLTSVYPGEEIKFNIKKYKTEQNGCIIIQLYDIYNKSLGNTQITFPDKTPLWNLGYLLYPYFGGNEKAPHDMNIELEYYFL